MSSPGELKNVSSIFEIGTPYRFSRELRFNIEEEIKTLSIQLSSGYAGDYSDYKYRVGVIRGLKYVLNYLDDQMKKENNGAS